MGAAGGAGGGGSGGGGVGGGGTIPVLEAVPPQPSVAQQQTPGDVAAASGLVSGEAVASDAAPAEGTSESQPATDESNQDGDKANGSGGNIILSIIFRMSFLYI